MCSIRQSDRPWRFKSGAVFERLDSFRARLHALQDLFQSAAAFGRLERIEIGDYQVSALLCRFVMGWLKRCWQYLFDRFRDQI